MNEAKITIERKPNRIPDFDYKQGGAYFITICVADGLCLLGAVSDFEVALSKIGVVCKQEWSKIPIWFSNVSCDEFVIMPNHIHGILNISHAGLSLGKIVATFKAATTRFARQGGLIPADRQLWQHRFYDHVVRTDKSLLAIRQYIRDNPVKWHLDELNPERG
jgi:putative transposase